MAFEVTKLIHGEEEANKAVSASAALFEGGVDTSSVPTYNLPRKKFEEKVRILEVAQGANLISSMSEGRRLVSQGGLFINNKKLLDPNEFLSEVDFEEGFALLKKGKKNFVKVVLS